MARPVVWFFVASVVTTILHELTHACVAYALGVRSTLFSYFVDLEPAHAQMATSDLALIGISGPVWSLVAGTIAWRVFRRARGSAVELPLLYLSVFGIGTFFGNLMSTSFAGDFSAAAAALQLPMTVRYGITVAGLLGLAAVHFWGGRQLVRSVPAHLGRAAGTAGVIVLPVVLGTAAVILVNQPMPPAFVSIRVAEASFWLFAALGSLLAKRDPGAQPGSLAVQWGDGVAALLVILTVRLMVRGIPLVP